MGILTKVDYEKILNYYNIPFSSSESSKQVKNKAEEILADKLCKCIKKVKDTKGNSDDNADEARAIGICNDTIFRRKGIKHSAFTCKKKPKLLRFSGKKYSLVKRSKYLSKKQKLRRLSLTMKK
jgi:hypothetical protein